MVKEIIILISAIVFISYGYLCLMTNHMKAEFNRYGLTKFRQLTGILELLGGIGLLVGLSYLPILFVASAGLSILMFLGTLVRIRVKDPVLETIPAFFLMLINIYIFMLGLN